MSFLGPKWIIYRERSLPASERGRAATSAPSEAEVCRNPRLNLFSSRFLLARWRPKLIDPVDLTLGAHLTLQLASDRLSNPALASCAAAPPLKLRI